MNAAPAGRGEAETPKQRTDRQLVELLNELRVALPGAQFLFAFLLAVPFAARFAEVGEGQKILFAVCLLATLTATILIRSSLRMFLAGVAALAVAMTTAVWFVSAFLLGRVFGVAAALVSVVLVGLTWLVLPLRSGVHGGEAE